MATTSTITQQYALKWNNFYTNLSSSFHELFEAAELVDVTLAVDGKFLQAHKLVLSICSPYFKELFKANPCKHPIVILKDVGHENMKSILEFMYIGEVSVLRENLTSFLKTAELLQVKGLTGDDSSESSSKEDEKFDSGEPEDIDEYSGVMQNIDYAHQQSYNNCMEFQNISQSPQSINNNSINKRYQKSTNNNGKRTKIDNNSNQSNTNSISNTPYNMTLDDDLVKNSNLENLNDTQMTTINDYSMKPKLKNEESNLEQGPAGGKNLPAQQHDNTVIDQARCFICGKSMRKSSIRRHMFDVHCPTQRLPCEICQKKFKTLNSLTTHMISIHKQFKSGREKNEIIPNPANGN